VARKKLITPGERVPLKLTAAEREVVLDLACLPPEHEEAVQSTTADEPLLLTLNDLDDLGGYVAAEANHTSDKKLQKKLDAVFSKIERLLDGHTEAAEPVETVNLADSRGTKLTTDWATKLAEGTTASQKAPSRKAAKSSGKASDKLLYQLKITLKRSDPPIWRRIQIEDCTLGKLHEHIQTAMGWTNSHLHEFEVGGQRYSDPMLMEETFDELKYKDSTTTLLSSVLPKSRKRFQFIYDYDFGDSWCHEILFEGFPKPEPGQEYPLCVEGERACPPEDIGGIGGFYAFLKVISDPANKQHKEMLAWNGPFDAEDFDAARATKAMKKGSS
jgi:hypothetical protein